MSNRKLKLSRSGLIVIAMCLVVLLTIFFLSYLNLKNISTLQGSVKELSKEDSGIVLLRQCNDILVTAENHYRIYINSGDTLQKRFFLQEIDSVINNCNKINDFDTGLSKKIQQDINDKMVIYEAIQKLKSLADSVTRNADKDITVITINRPIQLNRLDRAFFKNYFSSSTDTVKFVAEKKKKGFFKKLGSLFTNKDEDQVSRQYVKGSITEKKFIDSLQHETDSTINSLSAQVRDFYQKSVDRQLQFRRQLSSKEMGLAETNLAIMYEIDAKINDLIAKKLSTNQRQKEFAVTNAMHARAAIQKITFFSLASILVLIGLLAFNIYKTNVYEKAIIDAKANAEKLAKLKSRFLSNMSHEIRTPLTAIMGFTEQISSHENEEQQSKYLNAIKVSSGHLLNTVNDILDFSKLDAGKLRLNKEPFLMQKAIEEVAFVFSLEAKKKNIDLTIQSEVKEDFTVIGDVFRFKQLLYNLISNAIKFTDKGKVEILVETSSVNPKIISANIAVRDTGIGIAADQLDFIFQEFAQASAVSKSDQLRSAKGTGLGLPICKMLAELQGGHIIAESRVGEGSTFTVTLPYELGELTEPLPTDLLPGLSANIKASHQDKKILVVEDNELNIMLISLLLDRMGFPHDVAKDGEQALEWFREKSYRLVLTDINIPKLTGIQFAEFIRKDGNALKASIPLVALTADTISEDFETYYKAGINKIIIKPFQEKEFRETVEQYMHL